MGGRRRIETMFCRAWGAIVRSSRILPVLTVPDVAQAAGPPIVHQLTNEEWGVRRFSFTDAAGTVVNVLGHRG